MSKTDKIRVTPIDRTTVGPSNQDWIEASGSADCLAYHATWRSNAWTHRLRINHSRKSTAPGPKWTMSTPLVCFARVISYLSLLGEVTCISPDRGRSGAARAKREGFPHATSLYFKKRPGPKLEGMPSHLKVQSQAKERILTDDRRKHTKRYEARST